MRPLNVVKFVLLDILPDKAFDEPSKRIDELNDDNDDGGLGDALESSKQESALLPSVSLQSDHSEKCSRRIFTSSSLILTIITDSTVLCFRISHSVAPSPLPMIATRFGFGWETCPDGPTPRGTRPLRTGCSAALCLDRDPWRA